MNKRPGTEYIGEAFHLYGRKYCVARPDAPPYIFDFATGERTEITPEPESGPVIIEQKRWWVK